MIAAYNEALGLHSPYLSGSCRASGCQHIGHSRLRWALSNKTKLCEEMKDARADSRGDHVVILRLTTPICTGNGSHGCISFSAEQGT